MLLHGSVLEQQTYFDSLTQEGEKFIANEVNRNCLPCRMHGCAVLSTSCVVVIVVIVNIVIIMIAAACTYAPFSLCLLSL